MLRSQNFCSLLSENLAADGEELDGGKDDATLLRPFMKEPIDL